MQQNQSPAPVVHNKRDDDEIDLGRLFGLLIDHKWPIAIITASFMVIGVTYAMLATPIYQADALLQVEKKSSGIPALGEMADMFATESEAATEIEIMKSRMVIGTVVDQLKLTNSVEPNYMPLIGEFLARRSGVRDQVAIESFNVPANQVGQALTLKFHRNNFVLFDSEDEQVLSGQIGAAASNGDWQLHISDALTANTNDFTLVKRTRLGAISSIQQLLSVSERGRQTGILTASIQHSNRDFSRDVLNAVAQEYMLQNIRRNAAEAENSLAFLQRQIPTIRDNLNAAEEKLNAYRLQSQSVDLTLETQGLLEQVVEIEKRINDLTLKEAEISRLYTREHPTYQALIEQKANLLADQKRLAEQVQNLPETQQQVLRFARDVEVNQEIYLQLLNRVQELNVLKAGTVGNVRIVDIAETNPIAVAPKKALIVVLATMLGGITSVCLVFVKAAFNRGIERSEQLEDEGITVYATIPKSDIQESMDARLMKRTKRKDSAQIDLLAKVDPTDLAIEALRGLRTSLHFAMLEARNNVIMISGPSPGVGKSFVTANLAAVLAQSGKRVLLIDGDIRRGYLHSILHTDNSFGLADILASESKNNDSHVEYKLHIQSGYVKNLDFISRGTSAPNPAELLMHRRMAQLMQCVQKDYDYVLIDTPPILAVTDAAVVGGYAGTSLLVARFGQTPTREIIYTIRRFAQNGVEIRGAILNGVEKKASGYYGYGYNYQYGYTYKS